MRNLLTDRAGLAVFTAALVVQMVGLAQFWETSPFAQNLVLDAARYDGIARQIAAGEDPFSGAFHQAPLYPYFAGLVYFVTGGSLGGLYAVQAVLGSLAALLLYRVTRRAMGRPVAVVAGLLAAFSQPLLAFAPRVLPTVPIIFLELLFLDRIPDDADTGARRWILPGVLAGLLSIAAPAHLLLLVWAAGTTFVSKRMDVRALLAFSLACLVIVAPVTIHNAARGDGFVPVSSNGGETFFHGNNPRAAGGYALMAGIESSDIFTQQAVAREIAETDVGRELDAAGVSRYWFDRGLAFIRENPVRYLWLEAQKLRYLAGGTEAPDIYSPALEASTYTPIYRVGFAKLPLILPFAIAGLVIAGRRLPGWLGALLAIHVLTMLAFYVSNRYRAPLEVLLLVPTALALMKIRTRRTQLWLLPGFAILLTLLTLASPEEAREARAKVLVNLGASLGKSQRYAEAEGVFRNALAQDASWARTHHYLGRTLAMQRRNDEAIDAYARAAVLAPEALDVRLDLVAALTRAGRLDEAHGHLSLADSLAAAAQDTPAMLRVEALRRTLQAARSGGVEEDASGSGDR